MMLACACFAVTGGFILGNLTLAVMFKKYYTYTIKPEYAHKAKKRKEIK